MQQDDWFHPAISNGDSVDRGLDAVIAAQESKLLFAKSLREVLCANKGAYSDSLTALSSKVIQIQKTIDFRVGVLKKSRAQAWFRAATAAELGPFPGKISLDAILPMTREDEARRLRNEIVMLWKERKQSGGMLRQGIYLWSRLLQLNHHWEELVQLSEPFQDLRLDELPEALPDDIASPSLIAYLKRVRALTLKIRDDLDSAFQSLFKPTEEFLLGYYKQPVRDSYRKPPRRQGGSQFHIRDSLMYMNFSSLPDVKELKKRYFELAKQCHPDSPIGSSERFQTLRHHYQKLLKEVKV